MPSRKKTFLLLMMSCLATVIFFSGVLHFSNTMEHTPETIFPNFEGSISTDVGDQIPLYNLENNLSDIEFDFNISKIYDPVDDTVTLPPDTSFGSLFRSLTKQKRRRDGDIWNSDDGETNRQSILYSHDQRNDKVKTDQTQMKVKDEIFEEHADDVEDEDERLKNSPYIVQEDIHRPSESLKHSGPIKRISYYLPWDKELHRQRIEKCNYPCEFVNNMSKADAVVFRASSIRNYMIPPFYRPPGQRWAFFTCDPAIKNYNLNRKDVIDKFNWTVTYQTDADIFRPFGQLQKTKLPDKNYDKIYDGKSRDVAWFVSHCETWGKREHYVASMRKLIDVDVFGQCGNLSCGPVHFRSNDKALCLPMLSKTYKDYVSEKLFKLFDNVDVIPVVRGGFDYQKYLPSGIFIDASQFKGPEDLAKHLLELSKDKETYVKMLKKKNQWRLNQHTGRQPWICAVCDKLHTSNEVKHYDNLEEKFNGNPPDCWHPKDL